MRTLDGLHVQVEGPRARVCADGGIARVGKRTGLSIAETGDIVFVAAEGLLFRGSGNVS